VLKFVAVLGILGLATLSTSAPLAAQAQSAVSSSDLESAVLAAPASNQATVQAFLQNNQVIGVANSMGVSTTDLSNRVSSMDEVSLSQVAERTRAAEAGLAGGDQTIVLGTTAILLIIIIVILLAS
jgi:predicted metalloprotease